MNPEDLSFSQGSQSKFAPYYVIVETKDTNLIRQLDQRNVDDVGLQIWSQE